MTNLFESYGKITAIIITPKRGEAIKTLVDSECLGKVSQIPHSWFISGSRKTNPECTYIGGYDLFGTFVFLHRLIMDAPIGLEVDHINKNTLDNRSCNLRLVSHKENMQNRRMQRNNTSGVRGVWWDKKSNKWRACIRKDGKTIHLGTFSTIDDAEKVVIEARKVYLPYSV